MKTFLEINHVDKKFGNVSALKDINLNVEEGSFVCLLGPSGCGKTTLLRIMAGFEKPTSGQILLNGKDISAVPPHKRGFGMVFQSLALFPHMSVAENIAYGLKLRGVKNKQKIERVDELLHVIDLPHIADRQVSQLSGGQRQRVAIARALAVQPKLFLLDEPLSALDAQLRDNMQIELRQLQQKFGVTTILVTHDQSEAMMLADSLVVLKDGVVKQIGSPTDVYLEPKNKSVAEFLGASNIVKGQPTKDGFLEIFGHKIKIPTVSYSEKKLDVSIRAENIKLVSPDNGNLPIGIVEFIRDIGLFLQLIVNIDGDKLNVRLNVENRLNSFSVGQKVGILIDPEQCTLFENT